MLYNVLVLYLYLVGFMALYVSVRVLYCMWSKFKRKKKTYRLTNLYYYKKGCKTNDRNT